LTTREVEELFRLIRELKARGLAIIYISHRLEELESIADRLTILRDGKVVRSGVWGELSTDELIRHMAGRELTEIFPPRNVVAGGMARLTDDRKHTGVCLNRSHATNLTLANVRAVLKGWRLDRKLETEAASEYIAKLHIRPPEPARIIGRMSGGNQQKVLLARW